MVQLRTTTSLSVNFLKEIFFCPQDMIGLLRSNLGIFSIAKVWCLGFYVVLPGVVESTHPFAARVVDSRPSALLHPSGGQNCLTRCRFQMFMKPQVCAWSTGIEPVNTSLDTNPVTGCGQVCLISVI